MIQKRGQRGYSTSPQSFMYSPPKVQREFGLLDSRAQDCHDPVLLQSGLSTAGAVQLSEPHRGPARQLQFPLHSQHRCSYSLCSGRRGSKLHPQTWNKGTLGTISSGAPGPTHPRLKMWLKAQVGLTALSAFFQRKSERLILYFLMCLPQRLPSILSEG